MFEVRVMSSGVNVSQGKEAWQSSTLRDRSKFDASRAVDGNTGSFSHTGDDNVPWWEVDLGETLPIESITILNRWCRNSDDPFDCLCRLSHAAVTVMDENDNWVASKFLGDTCGVLEINIAFDCAY